MEDRDIAELFLYGFINSMIQSSKPAQEPIQVKQEQVIIRPIPQRIVLPPVSRRQLVEMPIISTQRPIQRLPQPAAESPSKISFLIKDPAITEIECIGADQPLLVKKAGAIQKTTISLNVEEVYQIIAEFSQKTKIPVIEGTFKAALNNLILTAVLSEMLGPRFILQKKNPFQPLLS